MLRRGYCNPLSGLRIYVGITQYRSVRTLMSKNCRKCGDPASRHSRCWGGSLSPLGTAVALDMWICTVLARSKVHVDCYISSARCCC